MPTQTAASILSGLKQQQWTGLRGLEKVQCLSAEGRARAREAGGAAHAPR